MPSVSWVLLTYNRCEKVKKSVIHNIENAGCKYDELVWVDNGSTDGVRDFCRSLNPDISVLHNRNFGVSRGYNPGMALATCDYIVITGCDMLMPKDWLKTFKSYVENVPNTGVACMYSRNFGQHPERMRKGIGGAWQHNTINGHEIIHALPIERRIFSRDLLKKIGYLREDFGMYGYEDVEWAERAIRVCDELGLLYYIIPDMTPIHLGTEGRVDFDGKDEAEYHAFKAKEAVDPKKAEVMGWCRERNWPYFNPYA